MDLYAPGSLVGVADAFVLSLAACSMNSFMDFYGIYWGLFYI